MIHITRSNYIFTPSPLIDVSVEKYKCQDIA